MAVIHRLASEIQDRLGEIPDIEDVTISGRSGQDELRIEPLEAALAAYRLNPEDVLNTLNVVRREGVPMQVGFTLEDGRELPLTVRRPELPDFQVLRSIEALTIATDEGVLPLGEVTTGIRMPAVPMIAHHNGRRELALSYSFAADAPETGPERLRLDEAVEEIVRSAYRPPGYTIEAAGAEESTDWFRLLLIPILLLLYAVLAITFESLTMPLLVLLAVPLTILGATWALVLAGVGAGVYALVGVIALLGLTVNPAILLVDRMQRRSLDAGASGGSAAIAAVSERTRPVLMTSCTTIAGLWPLALSTGDEFEIWPPFATVVMGGLATSTVLTLLVIPVGYVLFARLDRIFGRLGPWILMAWVAATAAVIAPLVATEQLTSMTWQIVTTMLVAGAFLWLALALFRREPLHCVRSQRSGDRSALPQESLRPAGADQEGLEARQRVRGESALPHAAGLERARSRVHVVARGRALPCDQSRRYCLASTVLLSLDGVRRARAHRMAQCAATLRRLSTAGRASRVARRSMPRCTRRARGSC